MTGVSLMVSLLLIGCVHNKDEAADEFVTSVRAEKLCPHGI
jgi:hypothetical protein